MGGRAPGQRRGLRIGCLASLVASAVACDGGGAATTTAPIDVPETVALGELPEPLTDRPTPTVTSIAPSPVATTALPRLDAPIGAEVAGTRLLLVGDTVLASTAPRNDGPACEVLTALGWDVEVDAEPGRSVAFVHDVLDRRLAPEFGLEWDAVVLVVGNLLDGSVAEFESQLDAAIDRVAPRPVVLVTVTGDAAAPVNDVIRSRPDQHANVVVVDWASHVIADQGTELVEGSGPVPTPAGRERLVVLIGTALTRAPVVAETTDDGDEDGEDGEPPVGECLPTAFVDDSAIVL